jgi:hypothetical protein
LPSPIDAIQMMLPPSSGGAQGAMPTPFDAMLGPGPAAHSGPGGLPSPIDAIQMLFGHLGPA